MDRAGGLARSPGMTTLLWFKRDLRVSDHPALARAAAQGPVLPLYIVEPGLWRQPDMSARHWEFTAECLDGLAEEQPAAGDVCLRRQGALVGRLVFRHRLVCRVADRGPAATHSSK